MFLACFNPKNNDLSLFKACFKLKCTFLRPKKLILVCFSLVLSLKATILRSFGPPRGGHALEAHFHHFEAVSKRAVF